MATSLKDIRFPDHWIQMTLGDLLAGRGKSLNPTAYPDTIFELYSVPSFDKKRPEIVSGSEIGSNKQYVEKDMVLLCKINPRINRVWVVGDFSDYEKIASTEWIVFSRLSGVIPKYLAYYMSQNTFAAFLASNASGVGGSLMRVKPSTIDSYPFPLAPLDEQQRIVREIEAYFSQLDTWLEVMEKLRAQLPRLRASILKAAVEGRLVEQVPDDEPAKFLVEGMLSAHQQKWEREQISRMSKPPKDDSWKGNYQPPKLPDVDQLPLLPNGWEWVTIDVCTDYSIYGPRFSSDDYAEHGVPVIRTTDIDGNGKIDLSQVPRIPLDVEQIEKYQLSTGDLLVTRTGSIGTVAIFPGASEPCIPGAYLIQFRLWNDFLDSRYVLNYLISPHGQGQLLAGATSVTLSNINAPAIKAIVIPLPPFEEQNRIVDEIALKLSILNRLDETIEVNIKRAERMRQSILNQAFQGRLVEQYPDDEPASELLERIQSERQRRTEEEKQKPRQQKERQVITQTERKSLHETLKEAGKPLSARYLFQQAGFTHETIDEFYDQLREMIRDIPLIQVWREDDETFLEVTE
jgi:type I restriction enzyme, S subunit